LLASKLVKGLKKKWRVLSKRLVNKLRKLWLETLKTTLNGAMAVSLVVALIWLGPKLYFVVFPPQGAESLQGEVQAEELVGDFALEIDNQEIEARSLLTPPTRNFQPPYNENLPEGDWLIIPRVGVRSLLQPTEKYEEALDTGVWLAPDFGRPGDQDQPMIVAGHRYGFKWWWKNDYWRYHSFYLLPDLEPGDTVEVISGKRKYVYEIYLGEEGSEITDYQADLILYTCKYLDSPLRIFRYARLLPVEAETLLKNL
jgi:sortase (surface protein transpeptidase)